MCTVESSYIKAFGESSRQAVRQTGSHAVTAVRYKFRWSGFQTQREGIWGNSMLMQSNRQLDRIRCSDRWSVSLAAR